MTVKTSFADQRTEGDPRWAAVLARDPRADGRFYYSVTTTGIYCRPSCPARRPRPEHVRFHTTPEAAEQAGYRPCRRCRPDQPAGSQRHAAMVADLCRFIMALSEVPTLRQLAGRAGMSPYHLHRVFKRLTGLTPAAYADGCRADRLRRELLHSATVTDAIFAAGYNSTGPFYATAKGVLGMSATTYRRRGERARIRFAVGDCSLGSVLVAASDTGVCAILLGDEPEALLHDLEERFSRAELLGADAAFEQWVAQVIGFIEAPAIGLDLPLDIRGTAFQQRVWRALRAVPPGKTVSYAQLARRIGSPTAVRAVAGACAANPLAVAIPCHRVVRSDGALSGYRWGVERKRALLEREGVALAED